MANPRNQAAVQMLREQLGGASTFFLVDYQGLSAGEFGQLRNQVRAAGGRVLVAKNTLINVVLKEHGVEGFEEVLTGPTALVLVGEDVAAPVKAIRDFAKNHPKELPVSKGGRLEGTALGPDALERVDAEEAGPGDPVEVLGVPVLDGMMTGFKMAEMMAEYRAAGFPIISRKGFFEQPPQPDYVTLRTFLGKSGR